MKESGKSSKRAIPALITGQPSFNQQRQQQQRLYRVGALPELELDGLRVILKFIIIKLILHIYMVVTIAHCHFFFDKIYFLS